MTTARATPDADRPKVERIRALALTGISQRQIARKFGLTAGIVSGLCRRNGIRTIGGSPASTRRRFGSV